MKDAHQITSAILAVKAADLATVELPLPPVNATTMDSARADPAQLELDASTANTDIGTTARMDARKATAKPISHWELSAMFELVSVIAKKVRLDRVAMSV